MYVYSVRIADYSTGSSSAYGDQTGTYQSIKITPGNSAVAEILSKPPPKSLKQRWIELSFGAKIAADASIGVFIALAIGAWVLCCV